MGASHVISHFQAVTRFSDAGNGISGQGEAIELPDEWDETTQVDALAQLPMACLLTVNVADHVAGRVYQVAADSALGGLSARGWAALLSVEVSR